MYAGSARFTWHHDIDQETLAVPSKQPDKESRSCPRAKDYIFIFCRNTAGMGMMECLTNDIGAGGVCFDSTRELVPGIELWMEMYVPLDYNKKFLESVYVKGRVVWSAELNNGPEGNRYRQGVRFTRIAEKDRERIASYVEDGFVDRRY